MFYLSSCLKIQAFIVMMMNFTLPSFSEPKVTSSNQIALTVQHSSEHVSSINKHLKKRKEANSLTLEAESDKFFLF